MAHLKKWTVVVAGGAALSLAGVLCVGAGLAGAQTNDAMRHSVSTASPTVKFKPGTYEWYNDGAPFGTITVAKHSVFSSSVVSDTGTWVQSGKTFALYITGGGDASGDCVFAGKVKASGTGVSSASKPGSWVCPGASSGTFYIGPVPAGASATQAHGGSFTQSVARPTNRDLWLSARTSGPWTATTAAISASPLATPTPARSAATTLAPGSRAGAALRSLSRPELTEGAAVFRSAR